MHPDSYEELIFKGVLLQMNIMSLAGYYSPDVRKTAELLIDKKQIHFVGSDLHGPRHIPFLKEALHTAYYQKACMLNLRNNQL
jgi:tyrosine-protein phosphatase YwqE